jgi:hypothetical protein
VAEVAAQTGLSRQTIARIFERERGFLILKQRFKGDGGYDALSTSTKGE